MQRMLAGETIAAQNSTFAAHLLITCYPSLARGSYSEYVFRDQRRGAAPQSAVAFERPSSNHTGVRSRLVRVWGTKRYQEVIRSTYTDSAAGKKSLVLQPERDGSCYVFCSYFQATIYSGATACGRRLSEKTPVLHP